MIESILRLAIFATRPIRLTTQRLPMFERLMGIRWSDAEYAGVLKACGLAGQRLGVAYHWHIINALLIHGMRRMDREAIIKMALANEDLLGWENVAAADPERGLVIATPHYGQFVLSIITLGVHLEGTRDLYIFYEDPKNHGTNSVFDQLHHVIFGEHSSTKIVHNNRKGIVAAIKGLQAGGVLLIMPDVYASKIETYYFDFFGRTRQAMLGTGTLAHRTGASIVPMLSLPSAGGLGFTTAFAAPIPTLGEPNPSGLADLTVPYSVTAKMFQSFQSLMMGQAIYWQYAPAHFATDPTPFPDPSVVLEFSSMLPTDVRGIFAAPVLLDLDSELIVGN